MKNKKSIIILVLLLVISVGYAALSSNLKINGATGVKSASWIIHWANPQVVPGSVTTTKPTLSESNTNATYTVTLTEPGDYYEFTIDAVNEGSLDAEILQIKSKFNDKDGEDIITEGPNKNLPAYLEYEVTHADNEHSPITVGESLDHGQTKTYRVRVAYSENINPEDLEETDITTKFYFEIEYKQKDKTSSEENETAMICKKATTLYTEECQCSSSNYGCEATGYTLEGSGTTVITYGHTDSSKLENGKLTNGVSQGYALDCNVDGTGYNERFYYVSDYYDTNTKTFNNDYATLIYYKNIGKSTYNGTIISNNNYSGPTGVLSLLPTSGEEGTWKNISLLNEERQILNEGGVIGNLPLFSYTGKAARLLTTQEIAAATGRTTGLANGYLNSNGYLDNADFLLEDTFYSKSSCSGDSCFYWLENPRTANNKYVWYIYGYGRDLASDEAGNSYGVRPAIEIPKAKILLD